MIKKINNLNLRIIANSGQCFRMSEIDDNVFNILSSDRFIRVKVLNNNTFDFDCISIFQGSGFDLSIRIEVLQIA